MRLAWLLLLTGCISSNPGTVEPGPIEKDRFSIGIILVGDTGTGTQEQFDVARGIEAYCAKHRCDLGLLLGDNIYPKGIKDVEDEQMLDKFEIPYSDLNFPFYPVIGNHDDQGSWQAQVEYESPHWIMPGRWYSIGDGKLWQAFALDTNESAFKKKKWPQQREWLDHELSSSQAKWKIAYGHHPVFSYGLHGDDSALKTYLKPILERNEVDFYVAGHDHNKQLFEREGVNYIISGAGAKSLGFMRKCGCDFRASTLGFAHLLLSEDVALLRFMDQDGKVEYEKEFK
jgi:tartrate-resistant acid phosphatase type 5